MVEVILHAERVAVFAFGIGLYFVLGGEALWLLPLLLAPDLSMIGYLGGPRLGAVTYNLVHNVVLAFGLLALGWWLKLAPLLIAGAIVLAHVGMDRSLGYGLKLPTSFQETHLGRIGRHRARAGEFPDERTPGER